MKSTKAINVKKLTVHEKRELTASQFHPAGVAVPTKRPGNCFLQGQGGRARLGKRISLPAVLTAAMVRAGLHTMDTENRVVAFVAAQKHLARPFFRNYFGRAEIRTLRAATGMKQSGKVARQIIVKSASGPAKLKNVSHSLFSSSRSTARPVIL